MRNPDDFAKNIHNITEITVTKSDIKVLDSLLNLQNYEILEQFGTYNAEQLSRQNKERLQAYLKLIDTLLSSASGQELEILQANQELIDAGLILTMQQVAAIVAERGDENIANWLQSVAAQLAHIIVNLSSVEDLELVIAAFTNALKLDTPTVNPQQWAKTQKILGNAYIKRIQGDRAANIEKAIACCQAALQIYTREAFPQDWASTQYNLGIAYGDRIKGERAENLELAIACCQAALQIYTREAFPQDWASTQNNLGNAYRNRINGEKAENIELAIVAYTAALSIYTREAFPQDWASTQNNLGIAYGDRINGEKAENIEQVIAYYQQSHDLYEQLGQQQNVASQWYNLALCFREWGKYQQALECQRQNLAIRQQLDDQPNIALAYNQQGRIYQAWGEYEQAIAHYQQSHDLYEQLGQQQNVASQWYNLALCFREWGKYQQALECQRQNLAIRQQLDDQPNIALAYNQQGRIYQAWGEYEQAIAHYQQSRDLYEQLGQQKNVANQWYWLADCYREWGKYQQALECQLQDLAIRQQLDDQPNIALAYNQQGRIYQAWGKYEQAIAHYQQSRDLYEQLGQQKNVANQWYWLADCYREWGKYQQALECQLQDLAIRQQLDDQPGIANAYRQQAWIYQAWGEYEQAIAYYQQSRDLYEQLGQQKNVANRWYNLALCYREWGKYQQALECQLQDLAIRQQLDDQPGIANAYRQQAWIYQAWGKYEQAIAAYSAALSIYTREAFPQDWARTQYNLGIAYSDRINGEKAENLEAAIRCYQDALQIYTPEQFPDKCVIIREKLSNAHDLLEHYQRELELASLLAYNVLITTSQETVTVGKEVEISVNLHQAKINQGEIYTFEISHNYSIGSELNIILNAPGFQLNGDNTASLPLDPDTAQDNQIARFHLTALRPGNATISAELYRGDTFETQLETKIQVADIDEADFSSGRITTQPRPLPQPDFILRVQNVGNETISTCRFQYQLRSFRFALPFTVNNIYHSESLSNSWMQEMQGLFANTLDNISDSLLYEGRARLASLGEYLFQHLFPTELQSDFRTLIADNLTFTLLILTDHYTSIPWEILHDGHKFLSDRFIIGRWLRELNDTIAYEFPVGAVNVSYYANVEQPELWATLLSAPGAPPPELLPEGMLHNLDSTEAMRGLHIIRYSQSPDAAIRRNAPITLNDTNDTQDIEQQMRPAKLNLHRHRPFVTLSYVKTDTPEVTTLEQTWAAAFIRAGCSGFTGSLWAVDPSVEAAFISCFYNRLWTGASLGEAFYSSRQLARAVAPNSLDWLAYVLFGDPMARPYLPVEGKGYAVVEPIGREIDDPLPPGVPIRFRLSLRRTPPVWHEERVIEVAENLSFNNLQVHVKTFSLQVTPASPIVMSLAPTNNYLGWFTLVAPPEMAGNSALVQVYFMDGVLPIHSLMFSLNISNEGGE